MPSKNKLTNSNKQAVIVVAAAFLLAAVYLWFRAPADPGPKPEHIPSAEWAATREPAPENIAVPEEGAENVPENVAVPGTVVNASPTAEAKFRIFDLKLVNGKFEPDTVIVRQGDRVQLNLLAEGGTYDVTQPDYGFSMPLPEGQPKKLGFAAVMDGKFTFYCASCGGPGSGPTGYLIVANQN